MATISVLQGWTSAEIIERNFSNLTAGGKLEFADNINKEIYYLTAKTDPSRITSPSPTVLTQGINTVPLPSGFDTFASDNLGLYKIKEDGTDSDEAFPITPRGSSFEGYRIDGTNLIINSKSDQTINIYFIPEIAKMTQTDLSDTFFVNDKYQELIRMGLLYQWSIFNRSTNIQINYQTQYEALKASYIDDITRNSSIGEIIDVQY